MACKKLYKITNTSQVDLEVDWVMDDGEVVQDVFNIGEVIYQIPADKLHHFKNIVYFIKIEESSEAGPVRLNWKKFGF